jgi:hypothetical protein
MYPPREPNTYRKAEQFPGQNGYGTPRSTAISFKSSGKSYAESAQQGVAIPEPDDASMHLTGTLTTQTATLAEIEHIARKHA